MNRCTRLVTLQLSLVDLGTLLNDWYIDDGLFPKELSPRVGLAWPDSRAGEFNTKVPSVIAKAANGCKPMRGIGMQQGSHAGYPTTVACVFLAARRSANIWLVPKKLCADVPGKGFSLPRVWGSLRKSSSRAATHDIKSRHPARRHNNPHMPPSNRL